MCGFKSHFAHHVFLKINLRRFASEVSFWFDCVCQIVWHILAVDQFVELLHFLDHQLGDISSAGYMQADRLFAYPDKFQIVF